LIDTGSSPRAREKKKSAHGHCPEGFREEIVVIEMTDDGKASIEKSEKAMKKG
jgi:hypothetical protein